MDDKPRFKWAIKAGTEIGAEFTMLPQRIRIRPVSSDLLDCGGCAVQRYEELRCTDLPDCFRVTFLPVDDAEFMAIVTGEVLTGNRVVSRDKSIPIAERKVAPCDSSST